MRDSLPSMELSMTNGMKKVLKITIVGAFTENYLYVTIGEELPRRLDEGGSQIADYNLKEFNKTEFADSVFAVPSYCNVTKPTNCPLSSTCGMFRQAKNLMK
jgi:hypothetical protein